MTRVQKIMIAVILTAAVLLMPGCSKSGSQAKKPQTASNQKAKAPTEMKSIASDLEKIIAALEQKVKLSTESVWQQSSQNTNKTKQSSSQTQNQQSQTNQQTQKSQNNQQSQQSQSQQGQQNQTSSSTSQTADWQAEVSSLKKIHQNWNQLEPEIVKSGLSVSERDSFEQALEKLTLSIGKQKTEASLMAAIELYGQYANLVNVYQNAVPPEFYKVKYELMSAGAEAGKKDWDSAQKRITSINENWNHLKVKVKEKDQKLVTRTEYSIQDMILALQSKELDILLVKTEIAMKNLQDLEKKLSSAQTGQSQ